MVKGNASPGDQQPPHDGLKIRFIVDDERIKNIKTSDILIFDFLQLRL